MFRIRAIALGTGSEITSNDFQRAPFYLLAFNDTKNTDPQQPFRSKKRNYTQAELRLTFLQLIVVISY